MKKQQFPTDIQDFLPLSSPKRMLPLLITLATTVNLCAPLAMPVWAADKHVDGTVDAILFNANQRTFQIKSSAPVHASVNSLIIQGNRRVILDIENAEIGLSMPRDAVLMKELASRWPSVKNISVNQFGGTKPVVRILLDFQGEDLVPQLSQEYGNQLELKLTSGSGTPSLPAISSAPKNYDPFATDGIPPKTQPKTTYTAPANTYQQPAATYVKPSYTQPAYTTASNETDPAAYRRAQQKIESQQQTIDQLNSRLLKAEAQARQATPVDNNTGIAELKRTLLSVNQKYDALTKENQQLRRQVEAPTAQSTAELAQLKSQLQTNKKELVNAASLIQQQNQDLKNLREQVSRNNDANEASYKEQLTYLNNQLETKEQAIRNLQQQISNPKPATTPATPDATAEIKRSLFALNQKYDALSKENAQLRQQVASRPAAVENSADASEMTILKNQLESNKKELVNAAELIKKQNQDLKNLREQMSRNTDVGSSNYKEQLTYLNTKLETKEQELRALQQQAQGLKTSGATANAGTPLPSGESAAELKRTLVSLNQRFDTVTKENQTLRTQLSALKATTGSASKAPDTSEATRALENKVAQLNDRLYEKESQLKALQSQISQKTTGTVKNGGDDKYVAQIKSMEILHQDEMDQLKKELEAQDKMLEELNNQLEELKTDHTGTKGSKSLAGPGEGQKPNLVEMKNTLVAINQRYEKLLGEKSALEAQLIEARKVNSTLSSGTPASSPSAEVLALKSSNQSLQRQLTDLTDKYQASVAYANEARAMLTNLEHTKKPGGVDRLKKDNDRLTKELSAMTREADTLDQTNLKLATELATLKKQLGQPVGLESEQITRLTNENTQLKGQLATLKSQSEQAAPGDSAQTAQIETLTSQNTQLQKEVADLKKLAAKPVYPDQSKQVAQLQKELADLKRQATVKAVPETAAPGSKQLAELTALSAQNAQLQKEVTDLKKLTTKPAYPDLSKQVAQLQKELSDLRQQHDQALSQALNQPVTLDHTEELADLRTENAELQKTVEDLRKQSTKQGAVEGLKNQAKQITLLTADKKLLEKELNELKKQASKTVPQEQFTVQSKQVAHLTTENIQLQKDLQELKLETIKQKELLQAEIQKQADKPVVSEISKEQQDQIDAQAQQQFQQIVQLTADNKKLQQDLQAVKQEAFKQEELRKTELQKLAQKPAATDASKEQARQLAQLTTENTALKKDIQQLKQDALKQAAKVVPTTVSSEQAKQLSKLTSENIQLKKELNTQDNRIESLNQQLDTLKQASAAQPQAPVQTSANDTKNQALVAELKKSLAALTEKYEGLSEERDRLSQEAKEAQETLSKITPPQPDTHAADEAIALREQLNALSEKYQLAVKTAEKNSTNAQALKESQKLSISLASAQNEIKSLRTQLDKSKEKAPSTDGIDLRALKEEQIETSHKLALAEKEVKSLKEELAAKKKQELTKPAPVKQDTTPDMAAVAGSYQEAEQHYDTAKEAEKIGQSENAVKEYQIAVSQAPGVQKFAFALSNLYIQQRNYNEAIKVLQAFIDREPTNKDALNQLGKAYLLDGQIEEASQVFSAAIPSASLSNYATSLKKLGKMSDAERVLKLALELAPEDSELLFNLGNLYNTTNDQKSAKAIYQKALAVKPDFAEAHYNLGLLYSKSGDPKSATTHLEKYLELSPNTPNRDAVKNYIKKLK